MDTGFNIDALVPKEMAAKAENVGVAKANLGPLRMFALAILAGAFIALGAIFATTATTGAAGVLPFGITKVVGGLVFCLGLILVVGAGAELFTGNNLIVMAWASGKVSSRALLRNWAIVYAGNFVGSAATAVLMFISKQYTFNQGAIGLTALNTAQTKLSYDFLQAVALGILCNALVCLAVWLAYGARSATDKIMAIIFPISAFVAAGFEHSVANMYFLPIGLFIKGGAPDSFWTAINSSPASYSSLTWGSFLVDNLLPVTIGNIIGGSVMVGLVYWFIYLRPDWLRNGVTHEEVKPAIARDR
jgi:formate transporter FocA